MYTMPAHRTWQVGVTDQEKIKMKLGDHSELSDLAKAVKNLNSHILVNFCHPQGRYNGGDKSTWVGDRSLAMASTAWSLSLQRMAAVMLQLWQSAGPAAHCAVPPPQLQ